MGFIILLALSAIAIAGTAAYFSIIGLASIFPGVFWSVIIMGTVLEIGKLVSVSFLYRFWEKLGFMMKSYLFAAIFVLMAITSAGIFGMLSTGYQKDVLPLKEMTAQIELLKEEKSELRDRKKQIDNIIAAINPNYITKRIEQQGVFAPETDRINARLPEITLALSELTNKKIQQEAHVGPIIFIAKALGKDIDDATKYMIYLIIFAFDPLAVVLTIGTNMALVTRKGTPKPTPPVPTKPTPTPTRKKKELKVEEETVYTITDHGVIDEPLPEPETPIVDEIVEEPNEDDMSPAELEKFLREKGEAWRALKFATHRPDQFENPKTVDASDEPTPAIDTEELLNETIAPLEKTRQVDTHLITKFIKNPEDQQLTKKS